MATLHVQQDPASRSGGWTISSDNPSALAAVPDAIVQILGFSGDAAAVWALHHDEQQGLAYTVYQHERAELGPSAAVEVVELSRPRQQNVVWIDRYHLVARTPNAAGIGRLLGLYAGSKGTLLAYVHDPSVSDTFSEAVASAPHTGDDNWDDPLLIEQSRFALRYQREAPMRVQLACAAPFRSQVQQALGQLASHVAHW